MISQNPLLAKMSMFQEYQENSTIPLPSSPEEDDEEEFIRRMSTKRSPLRETVSDNFDARYHQMNASLFDSADPEIGDIDYKGSSDDVDLQNAIESEESTTVSSTSPFAASASLFDTPIGTGFSRSAGSFASTSPYFNAFPQASTSSFVSSSTSFDSTTTPEDTTSSDFADEESTPIILSKTTSEEEERFFEEPEEVEDISSSRLPTSSFQGTSMVELQELPDEFIENHQRKRMDENEVTQFNGKYSVSATKYYVDNRIDGEHYENVSPESIEDTIQENGVEEVDPFAVEREMRKVVRMHAAKTQTFDEDPLKGLETLMEKDQERRRLGDQIPEEEVVSMETDSLGKPYEARETVYKGRKTVVNLWNKNLHGHDLMRFPGAIFDDRIDEPRRKSDKRRAVASRIVLSDDEFSPKCPDGQDVIFVRSDDQESSNPEAKYVEISEDDCVFACLTNSRPGGGASDCTALEYDKTRGFCYLMTSPPGDTGMTPRPQNPVTTYEKICIQQMSSKIINLQKQKAPDPVFVTAFSNPFIRNGKRLISSIRKLGFHNKIILYDLGIDAGNLKDLQEKTCNLEIRFFNFTKYPGYLKSLKSYRWKPIVIAETLRDYGSIWYLDSSVIFESKNVSHVYDLVNCQGSVEKRPPMLPSASRDLRESREPHENGWDRGIWKRNLEECRKGQYLLHGYSGHGILSVTNPSVYQYFPTNPEELKKQKAKMYDAGFVFAVNTKQTMMDIVKWYFLCALEEDCMAPQNAVLGCNFKGDDRFTTYAGCHRYDQSIINLVLANQFWYDRRYYVSEIVDFFHIDRAGTPGDVDSEMGCV
uniref:Apple domain-containing protein n=2 Tax=Caenorhabditis tropicalis TaxID=1561998 RepID=A0A1I7UTC7_9PELO